MKYIPISKVAHKYLYLAPGVTSTNILSIVHTYYSTNVLSINTYSTNVLKYLYLLAKSSTYVPSHHHIGLAKLRYLYPLQTRLDHIIYSYTKQGRNSNQTHRKINEYFYSFTNNPKSAILLIVKQTRIKPNKQQVLRTYPYKVRTA